MTLVTSASSCSCSPPVVELLLQLLDLAHQQVPFLAVAGQVCHQPLQPFVVGAEGIAVVVPVAQGAQQQHRIQGLTPLAAVGLPTVAVGPALQPGSC